MEENTHYSFADFGVFEPIIILTNTTHEASYLAEKIDAILIKDVHETRKLQKQIFNACVGRRKMVIVAPFGALSLVKERLLQFDCDWHQYNVVYDKDYKSRAKTYSRWSVDRSIKHSEEILETFRSWHEIDIYDSKELIEGGFSCL